MRSYGIVSLWNISRRSCGGGGVLCMRGLPAPIVALISMSSLSFIPPTSCLTSLRPPSSALTLSSARSPSSPWWSEISSPIYTWSTVSKLWSLGKSISGLPTSLLSMACALAFAMRVVVALVAGAIFCDEITHVDFQFLVTKLVHNPVIRTPCYRCIVLYNPGRNSNQKKGR